MAEPDAPNVVIDICHNSIPPQGHLSRQWTQDGLRVLVREVPCSGKIDGQYILHAIEGVSHGLCVVACPAGRCRLAQGNLRAQVRMRTVQRLLEEVGLEPERAVLLYTNQEETLREIERRIREAVQTLIRLGPSALHNVVPIASERKADCRPLSFRPAGAAASG
jgi:F420-non-reducing hydrogenase iron-sulfur subunit